MRATAKRPWTSSEERYLRQHRADGPRLLAHALGRTEGAVKEKASRLGVSLRRRPGPGDTCPRCGVHEVRAEARNAAREGLCPTCYKRLLAHNLRERKAEQAAEREVERAKWMGRRHG